MKTQYAMLVLARKVNDVVTIADREPLIVNKDQGLTALRKWWDENEGAGAADEYHRNCASWDSGLESWKEQTRVEHRRGKLYPSGPRVNIARLTFPDGSQESVASNAADTLISQTYETKHPRPAPIDALYREWHNRSFGGISKERIWVGFFLDGESEVSVLEKGRKWTYGFPITEALGILNKLSSRGWDVMHVSEDRGLYTGEDAVNESSITTARFLLRRT